MKYENELESVLQEIVARWEMPGLGVGIVEGAETIYTRSFGVQSLETGAAVTSKTIFCLASIGKCLVASAVMQLVEGGRIDLHAPLIQYLPYFVLDDDRYPQITVHQLLSHTSGMPDFDEVEYMEFVAHPEVDEGAAERFVRSLSGRSLVHAPGEKFFYSNIGYNVLGDLIAKTSGQTFEAYMQANVLLPAGMPDSTFLPADANRQQLAMPHLRAPGMMVNPSHPYHRADAPSSFLHATVPDMCQWAVTSLNRGVHEGKRILSSASYDRMWTPVARRGSPPFREEMGLGWNLGHFEGTLTVGHGGAGFGWSCFLFLMPGKSRAAIVLCNEESSAQERVTLAVARTMLDLEPHAGTVSMMVPICKAMQAGGMQAARARYSEIKGNSDEYFLNQYQLIDAMLQFVSAGRLEAAIDLLNLNLEIFPESADSYTSLASLHFQKGDRSTAEAAVRKALSLQPDDVFAIEWLARIQKADRPG